jgi:hypothetical protein
MRSFNPELRDADEDSLAVRPSMCLHIADRFVRVVAYHAGDPIDDAAPGMRPLGLLPRSARNALPAKGRAWRNEWRKGTTATRAPASRRRRETLRSSACLQRVL